MAKTEAQKRAEAKKRNEKVAAEVRRHGILKELNKRSK